MKPGSREGLYEGYVFKMLFPLNFNVLKRKGSDTNLRRALATVSGYVGSFHSKLSRGKKEVPC